MLMAAGRGTRLLPFTHHYPKALIPVMGIPAAQFLVDLFQECGVQKIIANIHHCSEISKKGFQNLIIKNSKLELSDESHLLLGSAGGIRKALTLLGNEPFFLANADVISHLNLFELAETHRAHQKKFGALLTLAILPTPPKGEQYREIILDHKKEKISGLGNLSKTQPFYAGVAVVEPSSLATLPLDQPSDFVTDLLLPMIHAKKVGAHLLSLHSEGFEGTDQLTPPVHWFDIGSPLNWWRTHLSLLEGLEQPAFPQIWRKRIQSQNLQIAPGIWCQKTMEKGIDTQTQSFNLIKPCYWGKLSLSNSIYFPKIIGPNAVVYDLPPGKPAQWANGISFNGSIAEFQNCFKKK
jgi:NDP-sugar pyrophosphorylase family protein